MITVKKYGLKIYNRKTDKVPPEAVYVGRPTTYGNPYTHLKTDTAAIHVVGTREDAIKAYRAYLLRNTFVAKEAQRHLRGKDLVCWCAPASCHAEILMEIANSPAPATESSKEKKTKEKKR